MIERIVIFGATGDLTARYLIPALAQLYEAGKLPGGIRIIGVDRREWQNNKDGFRRFVLESLDRHAQSVSAAARPKLVIEALEYRQADVTDGESVAKGLETLREPILAYLALPPPVLGD